MTANVTFRNSSSAANKPASTTVKGSGLTNLEIDGNIKSLVDEIDTKAGLESPAFTGTPTAPTQADADNSTKLATTAFVTAKTAAKANLASPAFTGNPTAPTQVIGDVSTKLATTEFVSSADTTGNAGSADILSTTRQITVGSTSRAFNGSQNIAWTLNDIGAQAPLVSGTNIKTINGASILGPGNIVVNLSSVELAGAIECFVGQTIVFTITNSNSFSTYTVSATLGTISRVGDTVTYTAGGAAGNAVVTVSKDGQPNEFPVLIKPMIVVQPTITSPADSSTGISIAQTFTSSAFAYAGDVQTHTHSQWQISINPAFSTTVVDTGESATALTSYAVSPSLSNLTVYYVRVRHKGSTTGLSEWSPTVTFTTVAAASGGSYVTTLDYTNPTGPYTNYSEAARIVAFNDGSAVFAQVLESDGTQRQGCLIGACTSAGTLSSAIGIGRTGVLPGVGTANIGFAIYGMTKDLNSKLIFMFTLDPAGTDERPLFVARLSPGSASFDWIVRTNTILVSGAQPWYAISSVDTDSSGNIYVAFTEAGGMCRLTKLSNTGVVLYDRNFDGEFYNTFDVHALDSGEVYVIDSQYQEIIKFTDTGTIAWSRYIQGPYGASVGPMFTAVDKATGEIFATLTSQTVLPTGPIILKLNSSGALIGSQKYDFADAVSASKVVACASIELDDTHLYHTSWLDTIGFGPCYISKIPRTLGAYTFSAVVDISGTNDFKGNIISSSISANEIVLIVDDTSNLSVLSFPKNGVFDAGTVVGNTTFSIAAGGVLTNSALTTAPDIVDTTVNFSSTAAASAFDPVTTGTNLSIGSISSLFTSVTGTF